MVKRGIYRIETFEAWCKRCGICAAFCPEGVLAMDEKNRPRVVHPEKCTGCGLCEIRCPDFAISVHAKEQEDQQAADLEAKATSQISEAHTQASSRPSEKQEAKDEPKNSTTGEQRPSTSPVKAAS